MERNKRVERKLDTTKIDAVAFEGMLHDAFTAFGEVLIEVLDAVAQATDDQKLLKALRRADDDITAAPRTQTADALLHDVVAAVARRSEARARSSRAT